MSHIPPDRFVAPRPAAGRARSPHATGLAACLGRSLIAVAIAGCVPAAPTAPRPIDSSTSAASRTAAAATPSSSPTPTATATSPAPTGAPAEPELLLLAFDSGVAALSLVRLSGDVVTLPLPDPSVAAVAPAAGGQLVAVLRDGRAFVAPRGPAGLVAGTGWRALALTGPGAMPPGAIVWSATSSPDGTRLTAIVRARDTGIIDPRRRDAL